MHRTSPPLTATTTTPRTVTTTTAAGARRPWNSPREDTQRRAGHGLRVRREPKSTLSISVPFAFEKARTLPKASALGPPFSEPPLHESYCLQRVRGRRRTSQSGGLRASHPGQAREFLLAECTRIAVLGLQLPTALDRTLSTTNPIENVNERMRCVSSRVKHWRSAARVLRWMLAGVLEAERGFRRLKGCSAMPTLIAALDRKLVSGAPPAQATTKPASKTALDGVEKAA